MKWFTLLTLASFLILGACKKDDDVEKPVLLMHTPADGIVSDSGHTLSLMAEVTGIHVSSAGFHVRSKGRTIDTIIVTGSTVFTADWVPKAPGDYVLYLRVHTSNGQPWESNKIKVIIR